MSVKNLKGHVFNPQLIQGESAYEIAVKHGFVGTEEEWLESYVEGATSVALAAAEEAKNHSESASTNAGTAITAAATAEAASAVAAASAGMAQQQAANAKNYMDRASTEAEEAAVNADNAATSESNAAESESSAQEAAEAAKQSASEAFASANNALTAKEEATDAATVAVQNAEAASASANAANRAKIDAETYSITAKIHANAAGMIEPKVANNSIRIERIEDKLGLDGDIVKIESMYTPADQYGNPHVFSAKMYRYARILKLGSKGVADQNLEYGYYQYARQYIDHIDDYNGNTIFSLPSEVLYRCPDFGVGNSDSERYANYIFFEGGKAYYHQGCRYHLDSNEAELAEGENVVEEYYGDRMYTQIVGLAKPIITDISDHWDFDGVIDVGIDYGDADLVFYTNLDFGNGYIEFAYMTKEGA